jgi:hypothetical protein
VYLKTSLSPSQLLDLWSTLSACYYDDGPYSTNTCEIYFYSLLPSSPLADKGAGPMSQDERGARENFAAEELANVLTHFCTEMGCKVSIYDSKPQRLGLRQIIVGYSTRVQVTVHRSRK